MLPQNAHQKDEHNQSSKGYDRSWKTGLHGLLSLVHLTYRPALSLAIVTHRNVYAYIEWVLPFQMWRRVDSSITTNVSEECVASVFRTELAYLLHGAESSKTQRSFSTRDKCFVSCSLPNTWNATVSKWQFIWWNSFGFLHRVVANKCSDFSEEHTYLLHGAESFLRS